MRNFSKTKRIVIKIGTNTLSDGDGIDKAYVRQVAKQINTLLKDNRQVLLVSSGAIGMGAGQLLFENKVQGTKLRQACAAVGQPLLMHEYKKAFNRYKINIAQVLLTRWVFNNREMYVNLQNAINTLLKLGCVPIINENDCVSTDEIGTAFGDNDSLSALVSSKIDADLLIILSDIDSLYDKDPRKFKDAKPIPAVFEITEEIENAAGKSGSKHATGGMKTKINAAKIASNAGCKIVIANGREENIIPRIIKGEQIGTVFLPKRRLSNRKRWILNSVPAGTLTLDGGAFKALRNHKSLLPSGIKEVQGTFEAGSVVMLSDQAKAVTSMSSDELIALAGKHSKEIRKQLGKHRKDVVTTPEDIVFLDF